MQVLQVSYSSAKASELPASTTDICLSGHPYKPEVAISTGVYSDLSDFTKVSSTWLSWRIQNNMGIPYIKTLH